MNLDKLPEAIAEVFTVEEDFKIVLFCKFSWKNYIVVAEWVLSTNRPQRNLGVFYGYRIFERDSFLL